MAHASDACMSAVWSVKERLELCDHCVVVGRVVKDLSKNLSQCEYIYMTGSSGTHLV